MFVQVFINGCLLYTWGEMILLIKYHSKINQNNYLDFQTQNHVRI